MPTGYLAKVMQALTRHGLVQSQRGIGGGFTLVCPPAEISIYDVVQAVDPIRRIHTCPLNKPEHATGLCPLHQRLDEAAARVEESFRAACVADMVAIRPSFPRSGG